jgi:2-haloacid dehalogenase
LTGHDAQVPGRIEDSRAVAVDVFGTTVDWHSGVSREVAELAAARGIGLDAAGFVSDWRGRYLPAVDLVRRGELPWMNLDALHRRSLDALLADLDLSETFDRSDRDQLVRAWHRLPAWNDARDGLARLRDRFTLAALSNAGFAQLTTIAKTAGLTFDCIISAELARSYKPDPEAYLTAVRLLDLEPRQLLMVACHAWDIQGAHEAGLSTAFLGRPDEKGPNTEADRPEQAPADLTVTSFHDLADALGC